MRRVGAILIVEDDRDLALVLAEQFKANGREVRTWENHFGALLTPPPWHGVESVVLDMWLTPEGLVNGFPFGFSVLQFVALNFPDVKRVVYSGVPPELLFSDPEQALTLADAVLLKPTPSVEILRVLDGIAR